MRLPSTEAEARLLVTCFPLKPVPEPPPHAAPHTALTAAIARAEPENGTVLIATDGSAYGADHFERVAAWGAAVSNTGYGGCLTSMDQSAPRAELQALLEVLRAAHAATLQRPRPLTLVIDNWNVAQRASRIGQGYSSIPRPSARCWREAWQLISSICALTATDLKVIWIPSHNKRSDWAPPPGYDPQRLRALNNIADVIAGENCQRLFDQLRPERRARQDACLWGAAALQRQELLLQRFNAQHPDPRKPFHSNVRQPRPSAQLRRAFADSTDQPDSPVRKSRRPGPQPGQDALKRNPGTPSSPPASKTHRAAPPSPIQIGTPPAVPTFNIASPAPALPTAPVPDLLPAPPFPVVGALTAAALAAHSADPIPPLPRSTRKRPPDKSAASASKRSK